MPRLIGSRTDPTQKVSKTAEAALSSLIGAPAPITEAQPLTSAERLAAILQRARQITHPAVNPLQRDFYTFLTTVVKTKDEARAGQVRSIDPHPYVKEVCDYLVEVRLGLMIKSRRVVASWITCAFDVWIVAGGQDERWPQLMLSRNNRQVVIASRKLRELQSSTWFLRNRVRFIVEELERNNIREQWPDFPEFEWIETEGRASNGGIISAIASGEHQARGVTGTFLHLEEVATWEAAKETIETMKLVTLGGGHLIGITTPIARSYAHQIYTGTIQNPDSLYSLSNLYEGMYGDDYEDEGDTGAEEVEIVASVSDASQLIAEANRKGKVLPRFTTSDGWEILVIHHSAVPDYDYILASEGMSPDMVQRELELSWAASGGKRVFADFGYDRHVATQPLVYNPKQPLFIGIDFGLCPAAVFTQINAHGQWLIFPSLSPSEDASLGTYEFGELIADHLQQFYCSPHGMQLKNLRAVWYGDPAGQGPPARVGDSPKEIRSCYDILRRGLEIVLGIDEDGDKIVTRKPGFGWNIRPGAVDIPIRLESVRARLRTNLRDGLPSIVVDPRATVIIEAMLGQYHFKQYKDGSYDRHPNKNYSCVDAQTELLTEVGWKHYNEVKQGDVIYSYNMNKQRLTPDIIQAVNIFNGVVPVIHYKNISLDMMVTSNHRCIARRRICSTRGERFTAPEFVQAGDLNTGHHLVTNAPLETPGRGERWFSDEFIRLCAWVMTEGTYSKLRSGPILVSQSLTHNPNYCRELDELILSFHGATKHTPYTAEYPKVSKSEEPDGYTSSMAVWRIACETAKLVRLCMPDKFPSYAMIKHMSTAQMRLFLYEAMRGDGFWGGNIPPPIMPMSRVRDFFLAGRSTPRIAQKLESGDGMDRLQHMATLAGFNTYLTTNSESKGSPANKWILSFKKSDTHGAALYGVEKESQLVDMVWCPTTGNGTWIARRNGRVFITGNSHTMDALQYIATRIFSHVPDSSEEDEDVRSVRQEFRSHAAGRYL